MIGVCVLSFCLWRPKASIGDLFLSFSRDHLGSALFQWLCGTRFNLKHLIQDFLLFVSRDLYAAATRAARSAEGHGPRARRRWTGEGMFRKGTAALFLCSHSSTVPASEYFADLVGLSWNTTARKLIMSRAVH
eukprot:593789-Rhodomonas_salina.1